MKIREFGRSYCKYHEIIHNKGKEGSIIDDIPKSSYESRITLVSKPDQGNTGKQE